MPELHQYAEDFGEAEEPQDRIETFMKVYQTMRNWQRTVMMHLEYQVQEVSNQLAFKEAQAHEEEKKRSIKSQEPGEDMDEFWSDFSDDDFEIDYDI
jgi:excinuclease UvrABC nuclease subunit